MDFYNQPVAGAFATSRLQWFDIARPDGSLTKVIAVSSVESGYWIIGYAIIVSMIFVAVAKLATSLILANFPLESRGNQYVMLVSFYNANSPTTAISQTAEYIWHALFSCRRGDKHAVDWPTVRSGLCLASVCALMIGGSAAAKFLVSGNRLIVRRAARANPDTMFFPNGWDTTSDAYTLVQPVRAAAAFQALGRAAAAKARIEKAVHVRSEATTTADGPSLSFWWDYSLTGADMGLQRAPGLTFSVSGQCHTRYDWLNTTLPDRDIYANFNDPRTRDDASVDEEKIRPAWVNFARGPDALNRSRINRGYEFTMNPNTSHRKSNFSNTDDIWYLTEPNPEYTPPNGTVVAFPPMRYQVRRGRPPLHCWQNDTWALNGFAVHDVQRLREIPGLQLAEFIRDMLFPIEFAVPTPISLGNLLGFAALESSLYGLPNLRSFSAQYANTTRDLERLVHISFVASREVVRNLVLLYSSLADRTEVPNLIAGADGRVPRDAADFILESQDVAAMSVVTLIVTPCVCALLWLIVLIRGNMAYGGAKASNEGVVSRHNLRAIALQASQLYRYLDEELSGGGLRWSGRTSMAPFIKELPEESADQPLALASGRSPFIQPKLVRIDGNGADAPLLASPSNGKNESMGKIQEELPAPRPWWARLAFWNSRDHTLDHRYEIKMTKEWNPTERRSDGNHLTFDDVLKDLM